MDRVKRLILLSSNTKFDVIQCQRGRNDEEFVVGNKGGGEDHRLQCLEDGKMPWRRTFMELGAIFFVGGSLMGSSLLFMVAHLRKVVVGERALRERGNEQSMQRDERDGGRKDNTGDVKQPWLI